MDDRHENSGGDLGQTYSSVNSDPWIRPKGGCHQSSRLESAPDKGLFSVGQDTHRKNAKQ